MIIGDLFVYGYREWLGFCPYSMSRLQSLLPLVPSAVNPGMEIAPLTGVTGTGERGVWCF